MSRAHLDGEVSRHCIVPSKTVVSEHGECACGGVPPERFSGVIAVHNHSKALWCTLRPVQCHQTGVFE
eukprot:4733714-Amphidinium_carterae.1